MLPVPTMAEIIDHQRRTAEYEGDLLWRPPSPPLAKQEYEDPTRKVLLSNLPRSITYFEIKHAIPLELGLVGMVILHTWRIPQLGQSCCLMFQTQEGAGMFLDWMEEFEEIITFTGADGKYYAAQSDPISDNQNIPPFLSEVFRFADAQTPPVEGESRLLVAKEFPVTAIWYLMNVIGPSRFVEIGYSLPGSLVMEFPTIFEANITKNLLTSGLFMAHYWPAKVENIQPIYSRPSQWNNIYSWLNSGSAYNRKFRAQFPVGHLSAMDIEAQFNIHPFNAMWPSHYEPAMNYCGVVPVDGKDLSKSEAKYIEQMWLLEQTLKSLDSKKWS